MLLKPTKFKWITKEKLKLYYDKHFLVFSGGRVTRGLCVVSPSMEHNGGLTEMDMNISTRATRASRARA